MGEPSNTSTRWDSKSRHKGLTVTETPMRVHFSYTDVPASLGGAGANPLGIEKCARFLVPKLAHAVLGTSFGQLGVLKFRWRTLQNGA